MLKLINKGDRIVLEDNLTVYSRYTPAAVEWIRTQTTNLSEGRYMLAAASVGDYVIFGGGINYNYSATVDVFKLDRSTGWFSPVQTLSLSEGRYELAAASVGDYVIFGGGYNGYYGNYSATVDVFKLDRTTGWFSPVQTLSLSEGRTQLAAASVGDYVIFGGGYNGSYGNYSSAVDVFKLDRATGWFSPVNILSLSEGRYYLAAASVGDYVIFGGGYNYNYSATVDVFGPA